MQEIKKYDSNEHIGIRSLVNIICQHGGPHVPDYHLYQFVKKGVYSPLLNFFYKRSIKRYAINKSQIPEFVTKHYQIFNQEISDITLQKIVDSSKTVSPKKIRFRPLEESCSAEKEYRDNFNKRISSLDIKNEYLSEDGIRLLMPAKAIRTYLITYALLKFDETCRNHIKETVFSEENKALIRSSSKREMIKIESEEMTFTITNNEIIKLRIGLRGAYRLLKKYDESIKKRNNRLRTLERTLEEDLSF